jgi:hypothetical protein
MGNAPRSSPFAVAPGLSAGHEDHASDGPNDYRLNAFRQWRPSPAQPIHLPAAQPRDADPYLFVLLADQELEDQRPEQAYSLIEAAYAAYDQCKFGS